MIMTKLKRSTRGLSPIFATLILIAIAVIAGIIVYMFTSGYLASMTGNTSTLTDKLSIPAASVSRTTPFTGTVVVNNMGTKTATIASYILKDSTGNIVGTPDTNTGGVLTAGETLTYSPTFGLAAALPTGTYSITVTTSSGGSFVSAPFTMP